MSATFLCVASSGGGGRYAAAVLLTRAPRLRAPVAARLAGVGVVGVGACWLAVLGISRLTGRPGLALDEAARAVLAPLDTVPPVAVVSELLAVVGGRPVSIIVGVAVAVALAVRYGLGSGVAFGLASAVSAGQVILMKMVAHRPGPAIAFFEGLGSFPSGHTANAAVIATFAGLLVRRPWMWAAGAVYVVAVALSRVVLTAHWFTDTVVGAVEGASVALLVAGAAAVVAARWRRRDAHA